MGVGGARVDLNELDARQARTARTQRRAMTEDGETKADYAYTPSDDPSDWKLCIKDAGHVGGAAAALSSGGFRGEKVDIPEAARAGVKAKVRAAWKRFHPDEDEGAMPESLKMGEFPPKPNPFAKKPDDGTRPSESGAPAGDGLPPHSHPPSARGLPRAVAGTNGQRSRRTCIRARRRTSRL